MPDIVTIELDCHDHAFGLDPDDPRNDEMFETKYSDGSELVGIAETYGILIRYQPDHPWAGWAWWYIVSGPEENLVRFLVEEYCGDEVLAREMVADWRDNGDAIHASWKEQGR